VSDTASDPTNTVSGAEAVVHMLQAHGVTHLFGLCGDTSLPFYDALRRIDHGITHILTRDERSAGYMADGYARASGKPGVCEGPSGGGATYILPGVVEANESSIALLAITTDIAVTSRGRFTLTELDQEALFRPLVKWTSVVDRADRIPQALRTAFARMTRDRPGAAHIGLPLDVQRDNSVPRAELRADAGSGVFPAQRSAPDPWSVQAAARALADARRPAIICGGGPITSGALGELRQLAEKLACPVATTVSGKGSLADSHPLAVGVVGANGGTPQTRELVAQSDLVFFIGCRAGSVTTEKWRYPSPRTRILHLDVDPAVVGATYPTEAALIGDARLGLSALLDELGATARTDRVHEAHSRVASARAQKFEAFSALAESLGRPVTPERLVADLQAVAPHDALLVADPGTPCPYFAAYWHMHEAGRHFISNRAHGALGYALSAAAGAWFAAPNRKCIAVMGDGSFGFTCGEMETLVRCGIPIKLVVVSNATYGWIKAGQRTGFGARYYSVDFSRTDHARVAEAFGVKSWRVEDPHTLRATLAQALAHDGPALVDVIVQPLHEAHAPVSEWIV
jgi:acetolactate synthase-1/2/3 large subunit